MDDAKHLQSLLAGDQRHIWHPFTQAHTAPPAIPVIRAEGVFLYTSDDRQIIDLISSWWVAVHGHSHPHIKAAIASQLDAFSQVIFADFTHAPAVSLAKALAANLPADLNRVFYSDDGSTAVEVALKLACQYWQNVGDPQRKNFISFAGAYHGDTVGAMSVGHDSDFHKAFQPLVFPVTAMPFPETWEDDPDVDIKEAAALEAIDSYLDTHGQTLAGFIVEPLIQGAAGMRMCRPAFLAEAVRKVRAAGALIIFDEVMTGFGRTGKLFACQTANIVPDLICLSKGLTGGFLPLSATVCRDSIYAAFLGDSFAKAFAHGHSFTGNALAAAAGVASLDIFGQENTLSKIANIAAIHRERLAALKAKSSHIEKTRSMGAIGAFDIMVDGKGYTSGYTSAISPRIKQYFLEAGLFLRPLGNTVYFLPPYCITDAQLHYAYDVAEGCLGEILG